MQKGKSEKFNKKREIYVAWGREREIFAKFEILYGQSLHDFNIYQGLTVQILVYKRDACGYACWLANLWCF